MVHQNQVVICCDDVYEVNDMLQNMGTDSKDVVVSICANCGKEGSDVDNTCNKCKQVMYCNAACKKKHRHKHKKDCEEYIRLATEKHNEELRIAAERHDEELFKQPPPQLGDCPICFLRLPSLETGWRYQSCCGKVICSGCAYAPVYDNQGNVVDIDKQNQCAFCRILDPKKGSIKEVVERLKKRVEAEDPIAIHNLGIHYRDGAYGFPQDMDKALELCRRAGELGYAGAYCSIGYAYDITGLEIDNKKAMHYYELAAMKGNAYARNNLGNYEWRAGNMERALKHYMISGRDGYAESLEIIKRMYKDELATKEDYTKALQSYQKYLSEIKSTQRDTAAAVFEDCRYY